MNLYHVRICQIRAFLVLKIYQQRYHQKARSADDQEKIRKNGTSGYWPLGIATNTEKYFGDVSYCYRSMVCTYKLEQPVLSWRSKNIWVKLWRRTFRAGSQPSEVRFESRKRTRKLGDGKRIEECVWERYIFNIICPAFSPSWLKLAQHIFRPLFIAYISSAHT